MKTSQHTLGPRNARRVVAVLLLVCVGSTGLMGDPVDGEGHGAEPVGVLAKVAINAETVDHLGGYRLTGVSGRHAYSIGPGVGTAAGTYTRAKPTIDSPRLDALLFALQTGLVDAGDDRSMGAAALVWWYADTRRPNGFPVWSDPGANFAPIGPLRPQDWTNLAPYTDQTPIGIQGRGIDFDVAEREVAQLHAVADLYTGTWTLRLLGTDTVRLESDGRPIPGIPVDYYPPGTDSVPSGAEKPPPMATTDSNGEIDVAEVRARWAQWVADQPEDGSGPTRPPDKGIRFVPDSVSVTAPDRHTEWISDGDGVRLATATTRTLNQELVLEGRLPPSVTTTTSTTTTTTIAPTTTVAPTTTTIAPPAKTTPPATSTTTTLVTDPATTTTSSPHGSTTSAPPTTAGGGPVATSTVAPTTQPVADGGQTPPDRGTTLPPNIAIPVTGPSRAIGWFLRFGDIIILVGVAMVVGTEFVPRRDKTTTH